MDILGIDLSALGDLLSRAREYAFPRLAATVGLLVAAYVAHKLVNVLAKRGAAKLVAMTSTEVDDVLLRALLRGTVISIWFLVALQLTLTWQIAGVGRFLGAAWIVALSMPVAGLVGGGLEYIQKRVGRGVIVPLDETALPLLNKIVQFIIVAVGFLIALRYLNIDITPILAGAGVAGLAISLAAQDTLSNLVAGILLIMDRPFRVGDRIELWTGEPGTAANWGDVTEIGLRATKIRNPDNLIIVIPNNEIMRRDIVNYTASGSHIRLRLPFGISYDADVVKAKSLITEIASQVTGVRPRPEPEVIVKSFGESAVDLEARVWIDDARRRPAVRDEITERVKRAFDEAGIEIPYPKRDLYLRGMEGGGLSVSPRRSSRAKKPKSE